MRAEDSAGATGRARFTVTVTDNEAPVVTAPDVSQPIGTGAATGSVALAASVNDYVDKGLTPVFSLTRDGVTLTSPATFPVGDTRAFVRATDSAGKAEAQIYFTVTIAVLPNTPIEANAGANGDMLSYMWTAPTGITLDGTTIATPPFTAPSLTPLDADSPLTVSDGLATARDTVTLIVRADVRVSLSGLPQDFTGIADLSVTATFIRSVSGIEAVDLVLNSGTVTGISGFGSIYTVQIRTIGAGDLTVSVPKRNAADVDGLLNPAFNAATARNVVIELTRVTIGAFLENLADALAFNQPGRGAPVTAAPYARLLLGHQHRSPDVAERQGSLVRGGRCDQQLFTCHAWGSCGGHRRLADWRDGPAGSCPRRGSSAGRRKTPFLRMAPMPIRSRREPHVDLSPT